MDVYETNKHLLAVRVWDEGVSKVSPYFTEHLFPGIY